MFDRIAAKFSAKASMRQAKPSPMLVTLVSILLTTGVSWLITWLVGDPFTEAMDYLTMGYSPEEVFDYVILGAPGRVALFAVISLLLDLYSAIMAFGYTSYALRLARNEGPGYGNLFDGFTMPGRVLWANILVAVFTNLWSLLGVIPGTVLVVAAIVGENLDLLLVGYLVMLIGAAVVGVIVSLRYRLSPYFLLDDPNCTARASITRSKQAMRGWKMELFTLDISFLGWALLAGLTFGVLAVWVMPYMNATEANFYDAVVGSAQRESPPPSGYRYDPSGSGDGPAPF